MPVYFPGTAAGARGQAAFRAHAERALIGVTSADHCIAETATLALKVRAGQPRCASLLPSIHIAVVRLDQILANLKERYALLKWDPADRSEGLTECLTLIRRERPLRAQNFNCHLDKLLMSAFPLNYF